MKRTVKTAVQMLSHYVRFYFCIMAHGRVHPAKQSLKTSYFNEYSSLPKLNIFGQVPVLTHRLCPVGCFTDAISPSTCTLARACRLEVKLAGLQPDHNKCLLVACLLYRQQPASVSQGRIPATDPRDGSQGWICSDKCTSCRSETKVADQTVSPSHNIVTPGRPVPARTL